MKINLAAFLILLALNIELSAQDKSLHYVSIQGTWDKLKDPSRAQFVGDNKLLYKYFNSFIRELLRSGIGNTRGVGEITFKINTDSTVDSLSINETVGQYYDSTVFQIIQSTGGKWRVGQVDGVKKSEVVTIWYSIYSGPKKKLNLEEALTEAKKSISERDYKAALKYLHDAITYDLLNMEAIILKAQVLTLTDKKIEACRLITDYFKYNEEKLKDSLNLYCE